MISSISSLKCEEFLFCEKFQKVPLTIFAWDFKKKNCNSKMVKIHHKQKSLGKFSQIFDHKMRYENANKIEHPSYIFWLPT